MTNLNPFEPALSCLPVQRITPTDHERAELVRFLAACRTAGRESADVCLTARAIVKMLPGESCPLSALDRAKAAYRAWLVFGELPV